MPRPWRPTPLIDLSAALHAGAAATLLWRPEAWPETVTTLVANHAVLTAAGLWPRSRLLGPNLTRLPAASAARGEIAITIDDGPDPEVTPRVLDILEGHGARATFFVIGQKARTHPALAREIVRRGHTLENHSENHLKRFSLFGPGRMAREVADAQATLADLCGEAPRFFRPPAGLRNPFLEPVLARHDLMLAAWTRRAFDTRNGDPASVARRLTRGLAAGDILLLHDGNAALSPAGTPVILDALPRVLAACAAARLRPVALREALEPTPAKDPS